jgi:hypothetical protein
MTNVYLWYAAVEGAKMTVVLVWSGSEGLAGPGNTEPIMQHPLLSYDKKLRNHSMQKALLMVLYNEN